MTPRNQYGTAPWSVVQDVLFRSNIVKNAGSGFVVLSSDSEGRSEPARRIAIVNNLWLGFMERIFLAVGRNAALEDLLVDHNTAIPIGLATYWVETRLVRFRFTNNLVGFGRWGVSVPTADALAKGVPDAIIGGKGLVSGGQGAEGNRAPGVDQAMYAWFPNVAAAGINSNGTLTAESPNRRARTDGKDIGVDFDELQRATAGRPTR